MSQLLPLGDLQPYFREILADKESDAPRLRLAEYLNSQGDSRAASITLGCELEHLDLDDPLRRTWYNDCIRGPHFTYFTQDTPWHRGFTWRRGFVDEVEWSVEHFAKFGQALVNAAPITTLRILGSMQNKAQLLADCTALKEITKLVVPSQPKGVSELVALGLSPNAAAIKSISIHSVTLDKQQVNLLFDEKVFPSLKEVSLPYCTVEGSAIDSLVETALARSWRLVDMSGARLPFGAVDKMRLKLGERLIPRIPLRFTNPKAFADKSRLGVIHLGAQNITLEEWRLIVQSGPYPYLYEFTLANAANGDEGIALLCTCGAFPKLRSLHLTGSMSCVALFLQSRSLDELEEIHFGDKWVHSNLDGTLDVLDQPLAALATCENLPSLKEIHVSKTWQAYSAGNREEVVNVPFVRPNGTECVVKIHHDIWP